MPVELKGGILMDTMAESYLIFLAEGLAGRSTVSTFFCRSAEGRRRYRGADERRNFIYRNLAKLL